MLQPDLQYIHDPAGGPGVTDSLILGLRAQVTF
jgi:carbohydrate-selective porin OprB